jgi:hypothetical protein
MSDPDQQKTDASEPEGRESAATGTETEPPAVNHGAAASAGADAPAVSAGTETSPPEPEPAQGTETSPPEPEPAQGTETARAEPEPASSARADQATPEDKAALDASGRERPRFLLKFPPDPELDRLVQAFERGNYALLRAEAEAVAERAEDPRVRDAALELKRRIEPDPLVKYLLALALGVLLFVAYFAYHQ